MSVLDDEIALNVRLVEGCGLLLVQPSLQGLGCVISTVLSDYNRCVSVTVCECDCVCVC